MPSDTIQHVDINDTTALKRALDEAAVEYFDKKGYKDDMTIFWARLFISIVASSFAFYSQFTSVPFPENLYLTGVCLIGFGVCFALLQILSFFSHTDSIFLSRRLVSRLPNRISQLGKVSSGIDLRSTMIQFQDKYSLTIVPRAESKARKEMKETSIELSVFNVFDQNGLLLVDVFKPKLDKLLSQFHTSSRKKLN